MALSYLVWTLQQPVALTHGTHIGIHTTRIRGRELGNLSSIFTRMTLVTRRELGILSSILTRMVHQIRYGSIGRTYGS